MIIELCGLPASGKSTFASLLAQEHGAVIARVASRTELMYRAFAFVLQYPLLSITTAYYITQNAPSSRLLYTKLANTFLHHSARLHKALRAKGGLIVVDEGLFQNIISIFERPMMPSVIQNYAGRFPAIGAIVCFDIPDHIREQYARKRGYSAREEIADETSRQAWLAAAKQNLRAAVSGAGSSKMTIYTICTAEDYGAVIRQIKAQNT